MIFGTETYYSFIADAKPLIEAHWEEIGAFGKQSMPLDPDWPLYKMLYDKGHVVFFSARIATSGNLVGYTVYVLAPHTHYKNTIVADDDGLFLLPEYRKGLTGYNLIRYAISELKKLEIRGQKIGLIALSMKAEHAFIPIAERLGFKLMDLRYMMEV